MIKRTLLAMGIALAVSSTASAICTPSGGCGANVGGGIYTWQTQNFATMDDVAAFLTTLDGNCQSSAKVVPQIVISTKTLGSGKKAVVEPVVTESYEAAYCVLIGETEAE